MKQYEIDKVIDNAFDVSFENWNRKIETELYPNAFADEYSWIRVKNSFKINNLFLKEALKKAFGELLD